LTRAGTKTYVIISVKQLEWLLSLL